MVLLALFWRVHPGDLDSRQNMVGAFSARAAPQNSKRMGSRVPLLLICCVTLSKSLPFSGLTSSRKEIRKCFI